MDDILGVMAARAARSGRTQVKQELIVTRLSHRLGLRQETVWAAVAELRKGDESRRSASGSRRRRNSRPATGTRGRVRPDAVLPTTGTRGVKKAGAAGRPRSNWSNCSSRTRRWCPRRRPSSAVTDELTHSGLRRILSELYAIHAAGAVADIDGKSAKIDDRPDLFEVAAYRAPARSASRCKNASSEPDLAYAATAYGALTDRALAMAATEPLTPAAFRDATGTSRKYVMAVLADLDRRGVLRRTPAGHVPGPRARLATGVGG